MAVVSRFPTLTPFARKVVTTARSQFEKFHLLHEGDPILSAQIQKYWTNLGLAFPGISTPWSAVFVSWCIQTGGASAAEFAFSAAHSVFVHQAIQNALAETGVFRAYPITDYAPQVGDLIHNNRSGNRFDYAYARDHSNYESHSAFVVEVGQDERGVFALTIGGNEADTIATKRITLNANGLIVQRTNSPFICVVQNRK